MSVQGGEQTSPRYPLAATDLARIMRIAAAQTPEFREDVPGALGYLAGVMEQAYLEGASLLCLPEGFLQGYLTNGEAARQNAVDLRSQRFVNILDQLPERAPHLLGGERCFRPGDEVRTYDVEGLRFGINICFDTNFADAALSVSRQGASLLLCPANNMLPRQAAIEWKDKHNAVRAERCRETGLWLMSADVTGAREDRVAWGPTAIINPAGEVVAQLPLDAPGLLIFDMPASGDLVDEI